MERLWEEFKLKASADARERLILHYAPLVKYVAGRVSVGLPPNIEQADLVSYGIFGLIDAIEKYDLERGIKFETYAISRIKGDHRRAAGHRLDPPVGPVQGPRGREGPRASREPPASRPHRRRGRPAARHHHRRAAPDLQPDLVRVGGRPRRAPPGRLRARRPPQPGRHPRGQGCRGPDGRLRVPGDEGDPGRRHQPARRAGEDRDHPLLRRGPHPGRDRQVLGVTESGVCQMHTKAVLQLRAKMQDAR